FVDQQAVTCEVNSNQGGGTCRMDGITRASQIELVRYTRSEESCIIAQTHFKSSHRAAYFPIGKNIEQIAAGSRAAKNAHSAVVIFRIISRILQPSPRALQE